MRQPFRRPAGRGPRRGVSRWLAAAAVTIAVALASPTPAAAHAVLLEATPRDGAELAEPPDQVVLLFNKPIDESRVAVVGPDGDEVVDGAPIVDGDEVVQALAGVDEPGEYEVAYRVVSPDGHVVDDQLTFTLAASDETAATPDEPTPTPGATPAPSPTPTPTPEARPSDDGLGGVDAAGADGPPWRVLGAGAALATLGFGAVGLLRRAGA